MIDVCVSRRAKGSRPLHPVGLSTGIANMKVIFVLLLVFEVGRCRVVPNGIVLSRELGKGVDEPCFSAPRYHDIFPYSVQFQLDDYERRPCDEKQMQRPAVDDSAYLLMKTMSQRKKRYTTYVTMCHFKMCNVGRKRTTRYFHLIKSLM